MFEFTISDLLMATTGTFETIQHNATDIINIKNPDDDSCQILSEISPRSYSVGGLVKDLPIICGGIGSKRYVTTK